MIGKAALKWCACYVGNSFFTKVPDFKMIFGEDVFEIFIFSTKHVWLGKRVGKHSILHEIDVKEKAKTEIKVCQNCDTQCVRKEDFMFDPCIKLQFVLVVTVSECEWINEKARQQAKSRARIEIFATTYKHIHTLTLIYSWVIVSTH